MDRTVERTVVAISIRVLGALVYSGVVAVLGGEPAVPCTRNPLQRG